MLYDWPLNRRVVPRLVWASSTGANKPILERLRRRPPQRVNWLVSSTTCLKTSSPTKNLTRPATNYDSKNPPSVNSKGRPLLCSIHCCQPPRFPHNSPVHIFKFLRRPIAMTSLFLEHLQDAVPYGMHSAVISLVHPVEHTPVYLFW